MKRLRFLKNCRDKYTNEQYAIGQEREFSNQRAKEILKSKCAEEVSDDPSK